MPRRPKRKHKFHRKFGGGGGTGTKSGGDYSYDFGETEGDGVQGQTTQGSTISTSGAVGG